MNPTRDPQIEAWYRNAATEEPPAALDAVVLAAAHRAVAAGPVAVPRRPRTPWLMPLAAAAVLVLSVTVLRLTPTEEVLPRSAESAAPGPREAVPSAPADTASGRKTEPVTPAQPAPLLLPSRAAVAPEPAAAASASPGGAPQVHGTGAKPLAPPLESTREPAVPAFAKLAAEPPAPARSTAGIAAQAEQRLTDPAVGAAPRAAAPRAPALAAPRAAGAASGLPAGPGARDPDVWIQDLLRLQAEGPETLFLKEFASFRATHPRHPLPPRLQEVLSRIEPIGPRAFPASPRP